MAEKDSNSSTQKPTSTTSINIELIVLLVISIVFLSLLYLKALWAPALLDEEFILTWLKDSLDSKNIIALTTFSWTGPQLGDSWSYISALALTLIGTLTSVSVSAIRSANLVLHIINTVLVYKLMTMALDSGKGLLLTKRVNCLPILTAVCFAVYPLTAESVFFVGGMAYNLGLGFMLASFITYLIAKEKKSWTYIIVGCIFYLLALFSDSSMWTASFALVAFELARTFIGGTAVKGSISESRIESAEGFEDAVEKLLEAEGGPAGEVEPAISATNKNGQDQTSAAEDNVFDTLLPVLPFLALGALIPLGSLPGYGNETLASEMIIKPADWLSALKAFWFPVNQSINEGYNKLYSFMYIVYGIGLLAVPIALLRSRVYRQNVAFLLVWLIMATVRHLHHIVGNDTMTGARWFYHASVPICALIVVYFSASAFALSSFEKTQGKLYKALATVFSLTLTLIMIGFLNARTSTQVRSYISATNVVDKLKRSLYNVASKAGSAFIIVRNVPFYGSITDISSPFNLILFDSHKQLIRAPKLVGGKIKDQLKQGQLRDLTMHWEHDLVSLLPVDLAVAGQDNGDKPFLDGTEIEKRLIPPLRYWKTAQFNQTENTFMIFSNWDAGPVLNISANGFDPLGPDFVYIEAMIKTPGNEPDQEIELSWLSTWGKEFERRDRLSKAKAITNDGKYHRYYLPVRSAAWSTNGVIQQLSFGFPKSATVTIKEIGMVNAPDRIPFFRQEEAQPAPEKPSYISGCYSYPATDSYGVSISLGESKVLKFNYNCTMNKEASKAICEVSKPNHFFENPNGHKLSISKSKTIEINNLSGTLSIKTDELKEPGIYSFRIFATDKNGKLVGNASDEIICLVNRNIFHDTK